MSEKFTDQVSGARARKRWRCYGSAPETAEPCGKTARWRAVSGGGVRAVRYYCDACQPEDAEPLRETDPYVVVQVDVIVTIPASTMHPSLAQTDARARLLAALDAMGADLAIRDVRVTVRAWRHGTLVERACDVLA